MEREDILSDLFKSHGVYGNQEGSQRLFRKYVMENLESIKDSTALEIKTIKSRLAANDEAKVGSRSDNLDSRKQLNGKRMSKSMFDLLI